MNDNKRVNQLTKQLTKKLKDKIKFFFFGYYKLRLESHRILIPLYT